MRVVVFASSSKSTPCSFLEAAETLGILLAKEGHTCVNGGGNTGGMGALNRSCLDNGGKIITVIHRRWVVDGEEFQLGDDGESIVVEGEDLSERKRKLIAGASCIIALPGGIGTLDELFDAACLKQLGFIEDLPICVVNTDGYYDCILGQLRAGKNANLIYTDPSMLIHSESTPLKALEYCVKNASHSKKHDLGSSTPKNHSFVKVCKALSMLPLILTCYTWLFFKTVNMLMSWSGEFSDRGSTSTKFHWAIEFFGLIFILLFACKQLK